MKTIYCISGLGATSKAFSKLRIDGYRLQVIEWLQPLPGETIEAYAARMRVSIQEENPVLMGLSFGGMMCIEIAKQMPVRQLILISSIKTADELPLWMKAVAKLRLHRIAPLKTSSRLTRPIQDYFLGTVTQDDREMAIQFRRNADPLYVRWAVDKVVNWNNRWKHSSTIHIHGSADKMFAVKKSSPTHIIKNGGHFLVMNRAAEVSALLQQVL